MEIIRPQLKSSPNNYVPHVPTLPLYRSAPALEVRLEEFELYAIDRLKVLTGISDGLSRGKRPEEMEKLVSELWKSNMRHPQASEVSNKDIISHFVLRLVYCRTEDLRKWFLSMETTLFRHRFRLQNADAQRALLSEFHLPYKAVSAEEFEVIFSSCLYADVTLLLFFFAADAIFYKVPFEEVPELVAGRRVFLRLGYAYVAMSQVVSLVATQFRSLLSKALTLTNRKWISSIREQERDRLTPLREDHHLKHWGRMQLGRFLKGVGLKLDDALAFWKAEFSQKVGAERFDKEYAYSIRHNYGKEGKRMDYAPYSCQKIISLTPSVGDHHGCPYRHFSQDNLRAALCKMGVGSSGVEDVMDKVRNKHYQLACTLTFEAIHGCQNDAGINHPNQYFSDSQKILKSKVPPAAE
ncbi:Probable DNA primase large subunit [Linum grandiflorum]